MEPTIEEIARAFSRHDFRATYRYLADDVSWNIVGGEQPAGRDAVSATCERSAAYLSGVATAFRRFRVLVGASWVVIDSLADYTERGGATSTVASCDIYDFQDGMLSEIASYTVELTEAT